MGCLQKDPYGWRSIGIECIRIAKDYEKIWRRLWYKHLQELWKSNYGRI
jgi:hypothetical protein